MPKKTREVLGPYASDKSDSFIKMTRKADNSFGPASRKDISKRVDRAADVNGGASGKLPNDE